LPLRAVADPFALTFAEKSKRQHRNHRHITLQEEDKTLAVVKLVTMAVTFRLLVKMLAV
jgi:hypothetical protein